MNNENEKESPNQGNIEIIKSDHSDEQSLSQAAALSVSNGDEKTNGNNDAQYDPRIYQLKSERLEKTLKDFEQEMTFLMDLLKNKVPKSERKDESGPEKNR